MPLKDPYWLVRSRAFLLEIPIFGDKSTIKQNIEILLFNQNTWDTNEKTLPSKSEAKAKAGIDLFEKKYGKLYEGDNYNYDQFNKENFYTKNPEHIAYPLQKRTNEPIYLHIPEIKSMKKTLSYSEIYTILSRLADPQMVFINMFKENPNNNLISGIIYFPYTPQLLNHPNANPDFILKFSKYLGLHSDYNYHNFTSSTENENEKIKILKQKLMDLYYLVDDCEDLHGVTTCLGGCQEKSEDPIRACPNISSFFCENSLCKSCCESTTNKEFCVIHDEMVNFFRRKMQEVLEFEHRKDFDRALTIRVSVRQRLAKYELRSIFEEEGENIYNVNWDSVDFLFRKGVEKIQFIYLQCASNEDARRLYEDRGKLMKKWGKMEVNIQSLMERVEDIFSRVSSLSNSGILLVPCSSLVSQGKKVPKKSHRNRVFAELIEKSLKIKSTQYKLTNCINKVNEEFSYDYFLVEFIDKSLCDKFFDAQPFLDSVIFHKLSHLRFCPLIRRGSNRYNSYLCVNCPNKCDGKCIFELCTYCCARQSLKSNVILRRTQLICPCSVIEKEKFNNPLKSANNEQIQFHCEVCGTNNPFTFDQKCFNLSKMCSDCCKTQISPLKICSIHHYTPIKPIPYFASTIGNPQLNFQDFIDNYHLTLSKTKLKLMTDMKNGEFNWFRPIEDTNYTRMMLDMNKELQIIMDNPNFRREGPLRINDKMYKIFTYQHETMLDKKYKNFSTSEGFDQNGEYYIDYDFENAKFEGLPNQNHEINYLPNTFVPATVDRLESIDVKVSQKEIEELSNNLKLSFHLILSGLDTERLNTYELIEEIYQELKTVFGKINKEDIHVLDEVSIISKWKTI